MVLLALQQFRQLGILGVLRDVVEVIAEEARARNFPHPPFGRFGFIYLDYTPDPELRTSSKWVKLCKYLYVP
jgi:hypothetical protein